MSQIFNAWSLKTQSINQSINPMQPGKCQAPRHHIRMLLWYLSYRRPVKAQASLRIRAHSLTRAFAVRTHEVWKQTKGPTKNQTSSPTGWLHMGVWRMSLWRTKSTIISYHGSLMSLILITVLVTVTEDERIDLSFGEIVLYFDILVKILNYKQSLYFQRISMWPMSWENCLCHMQTPKAQIRLHGCIRTMHPHSLISAFVVRCLDSIIPLVSISKIASL